MLFTDSVQIGNIIGRFTSKLSKLLCIMFLFLILQYFDKFVESKFAESIFINIVQIAIFVVLPIGIELIRYILFVLTFNSTLLGKL